MKQKWFEILAGSIAGSAILIFIINAYIPALSAVAGLLKIVDLIGLCAGLFVLVDAAAFQRIIGVTAAPSYNRAHGSQSLSAPSQRSAPVTPLAPAAKKFQPGQSTATIAATPAAGASGATASDKITREQIEVACMSCIEGLSDLEDVIQTFSHDLYDFLDSAPSKTKAVVMWGDASTGKTEFAHRLSGERKAQKIAGLNLKDVEVHYIAGMQNKESVREIVDKVKPGSIVFIDEADKFFDPQAGMLTEQESKNIKSSLIMNFDRNPIFWIFLGAFTDRRAGKNLSSHMVRDVFGPELGSRVQFDGYSFKPWTFDRLFSTLASASELKAYEFDDPGFKALVQLTLAQNGGPRLFLKCVNDLVKRRDRKGTKDKHITTAEIEEYISQVG